MGKFVAQAEPKTVTWDVGSESDHWHPIDPGRDTVHSMKPNYGNKADASTLNRSSQILDWTRLFMVKCTTNLDREFFQFFKRQS